MNGIDTSAIVSASLTSTGQVRTSNQDTFDVFQSPKGDRLFVVADGMGGHRGGATASRVAAETIGEVFQANHTDAADLLFDAITAANERVHQTSIEEPELRGMGTTVVCMLFDRDGRVWVAHVGDSRAYRLHGDGIEQITQDHSVVGEMVRRGLITPQEAELHPRRNEILRSVGVEAEVEIDVAQVVSAPGDHYLLCSDGLTGMLGDDEIADVVQQNEPEAAAERLVAMANARGGRDNITVQVLALPGARYDASARPAPTSQRTPLVRWLVGAGILLATGVVTWFVLGGTARPGAPGAGPAPPPSVAAPTDR